MSSCLLFHKTYDIETYMVIFTSLFIIFFMIQAIPLEQQGALEKVEAAMAQYFSSSVSVSFCII